MSWDPGRIVDHGIHAVTRVDDTAKAPSDQHQERQDGGQHHGMIPRKLTDPAKKSLAAFFSSRLLERSNHRKSRHQGRQHHEKGSNRMNHLEALTVLRVHVEMVKSNG